MGTALSDLSRSVILALAFPALVAGLTTPPVSVFADDLDTGVIEPNAMKEPDDVEVGDEVLQGLLTRRTVTRFGDEFYRRFANQWRAVEHAGRQSIVIEERPTATRGSLIIVRYAREVAFRGYVRPRGPDPEDVADEAVARVERMVQQYERTRGQSSPDLAEEELL